MFLEVLIQWHPLVKDSKMVYCQSNKQDLAFHANSLGNSSFLLGSFPTGICIILHMLGLHMLGLNIL